MKKILSILLLGLLCLNGWAQKPPLAYGYVGENPDVQNIYWEIDTTGGYNVLYLWPDEKGGTNQPGATYSTGNFSAANPAPWWQYRSYIKDIGINIPSADIGSRAFNDIKNLQYWIMPSNLASFGDSVFWGCTNLKSVEVQDFYPPTMPASGLVTSDTTDVRVIFVNNQYSYYDNDDQAWKNVENDLTVYMIEGYWYGYLGPEAPTIIENRVIMAKEGIWQKDDLACPIYYTFSRSDSLGSCKLSIETPWEGNHCSEPYDLPDVDGPDYNEPLAFWNEAGDVVEDLHIGAPLSYVGKNAFAGLPNLQMITFFNQVYPLNQMHAGAFSSDIRPWKWAFGDYLSETVRPPHVIMSLDDETGIPSDSDRIAIPDFSNTVLYVPDSLVAYDIDMIPLNKKTKDLFREADYWKTFGAISDRTAADTAISSSEVLITWFPVDMIKEYLFSFSWTDIYDVLQHVEYAFPTMNWRGWVDIDRVQELYGNGFSPSGAPAKRMPWNVGGSTATINIGSGMQLSVTGYQSNSKSIEVQISGMKEESTYGYGYGIKNTSGTTETKTEGSGVTPQYDPMGIMDAEVGNGQDVVRIYDIQGRYVGADETSLPTGVYIKLQNGKSNRVLVTER